MTERLDDQGHGDKVDVPTPRTDAFQREQQQREIGHRGKRDDTVCLINLETLDFARQLECELAVAAQGRADNFARLLEAEETIGELQSVARSAGTRTIEIETEVIDAYVMDLVRKHGSTMTNSEIVQKFLPKQRLSAQSARTAITPNPGTGALNQAYTPTVYEGHLESAPPPYINISEAKSPYEEAIITVRSPRKSDGSQGDSAFIVITKYELRKLLLKVARYWGWLPLTEQEWLRNYELENVTKSVPDSRSHK